MIELERLPPCGGDKSPSWISPVRFRKMDTHINQKARKPGTSGEIHFIIIGRISRNSIKKPEPYEKARWQQE